ncbi:ABC transporter permease subunit [Fictibacillus sp. UD]|uniref:ABC transporter permease subunit n=1 Tax=Fictibacillus sp. UD TaxID=3038777 RepID=UPI0037476CF8
MRFSFRSYLKRLRSIILGILIISVLPALLFGVNTHLQERVWEYYISGTKYLIFPDIIDKYQYSMTIFFSALLIGLVFALVLTFIATLLPRFLQRAIVGFLTLLESLPDLFIVVALQVSIVYIYKKTGIVIYFYNDFSNPIYLMPILVLSILPAIQLFKITFLLMQEEQHKLYVTVARAMGLGRLYITLKHVFINIITSLFQYSKTIFVFMLSNLFIVEFVFNLNGIMYLLLNTKGVAFMGTALIIALPFSLLFEFVESNTVSENTKSMGEDAA